MAARISPASGRVRLIFFEVENMCCISQEFRWVASQAMARISPISPTRL